MDSCICSINEPVEKLVDDEYEFNVRQLDWTIVDRRIRYMTCSLRPVLQREEWWHQHHDICSIYARIHIFFCQSQEDGDCQKETSGEFLINNEITMQANHGGMVTKKKRKTH